MGGHNVVVLSCRCLFLCYRCCCSCRGCFDVVDVLLVCCCVCCCLGVAVVVVELSACSCCQCWCFVANRAT